MCSNIENLVTLGIESISGQINLEKCTQVDIPINDYAQKNQLTKEQNGQEIAGNKSGTETQKLTKDPTKRSNPEIDPVLCICYTVTSERLKIIAANEGSPEKNFLTGILLWCTPDQFTHYQKNFQLLNIVLKFQDADEIVVFRNELSLLVFFMHLIQKLDPDILMTYDAERGSLMHIVHRASRYG